MVNTDTVFGSNSRTEFSDRDYVPGVDRYSNRVRDSIRRGSHHDRMTHGSVRWRLQLYAAWALRIP